MHVLHLLWPILLKDVVVTAASCLRRVQRRDVTFKSIFLSTDLLLCVISSFVSGFDYFALREEFRTIDKLEELGF